MKTFLIIIILLVSIIVVYFVILGMQSRTKSAPGLTDGQLTKCPDTPNCICTEYKDRGQHYLAPVILPTTKLPGIDALLVSNEIITAMGGKIHHQDDHYLQATFSSAIFGFVDDFEVRLDPAHKLVQLRSASRVGRSDLGINKKRVEEFKQRFEKKISNTHF